MIDRLLKCGVVWLALVWSLFGLEASNTQKRYFQCYDIKNGLTQNTVLSILQDHNGFMWFGTKDGLNRFDGKEFKSFIYGENDEYECRFVSTLCEASDGLIWVGTDWGVCYYDERTEEIYPFTTKSTDGATIANPVSLICEPRPGELWIVVERQGIFRYDLKTKQLHNVSVKDKRYQQVVFTSMAFDDKGRVWLGTFGQGLVYTDDGFKTIHEYRDAAGQEPLASQVVTKIALHSGVLYVSTEYTGLHIIDVVTNQMSTLFQHDETGAVPYIRDFLFYGDTEVWLATESGLYIYDMVTRSSSHYRHSLNDAFSISDNALYVLYRDREGGVWIGSYFGGVNYLQSNRPYFEKFYPGTSGLHGQQVREFCGDRDGNIWIGTEDGGLNKYDPRTKRFQYIDESRRFSNIHGLCAVGDHLWVGTFSQGIRLIDTRSNRVLRSYVKGDASGLNSNNVFSIYQTRSGELYIGTMSGLQYYDPKSDRFVTVPELKDVFIFDILEDRSGNLWVGTYVSGVLKFDQATGLWNRYVHIDGDTTSISSNRVFSLFEDSKGHVWITTQSGVCSYNPDTDRFIRRFSGLGFYRSVVYQMREDKSGDYWLSTNRGLYRVNVEARLVRDFTTDDGLLSNQFNYSSSYIDDAGCLYFGCLGGFVSFFPQDYEDMLPLPAPVFTDMWIYNERVKPSDKESPLEQSITLTNRIELKSTQNFISFKIASLSYSNPSKHRLKYKLEGFDKEWNYLPANSRISYSNLNHGRYVLKVMSYSENNESAGQMTELEIIIHPPFYLSVWAYIVYVLLVVTGGYYLLHYLARRNVQRNEKLMERYKQEKEKEMYDSKINFFTNVAHEIRTPLTLIKAPLENLQAHLQSAGKEVKESLDIMSLNVERLLFLTNQLLDFRKIESNKYKLKKERCNVVDIVRGVYVRFQPTAKSSGKTLELHLPDKPLEAYVDTEAITKIVSNLFTNAIKYSDQHISVELSTGRDHTFCLVVRNDGEVIQPEKREEIFAAFSRLNQNAATGTGIGLAFARSLAHLHGGTLAMGDSEVENVFVLTIPLGAAPEVPVENKPEEAPDSLIDRVDESRAILVVEDNAEMRLFIEKQLYKQGYKVYSASNGAEALQVLAGQDIDLIITDLMMPEVDGITLLKKVKTDLMYCHIPVIILSAKTAVADKIEGLESGADAYIDKPFSMQYLLANVATLIRNRQRLREALSNTSANSVARNEGLSKMDKEFLTRLDEIVQANYSNPDFAMDDIVEAMNMSRSSFYRKLKGVLNLSINDYVRLQRLKRAAELLKEGKYNVTEICYMVGFSSPSYFSKCFHKQYGVLPKDYEG